VSHDLEQALEEWVKLLRPLLLFEGPARAAGEDGQAVAMRLRSLVIDLALQRRYEQAIAIADLGRDKLKLMPDLVTLLDQAVVPAEQAHRTRTLSALKSLVEQVGRDPIPLINAVEQAGFGPGGTGAAKDFWQAFVAALSATKTKNAPEPWTEIRIAAKSITSAPGGIRAATAILRGLHDAATQISAPTWALEALDDDLRQVNAALAAAKAKRRAHYRRLSILIAGASTALTCLVLLFLVAEKPLLREKLARSLGLPHAFRATLTEEAKSQQAGDEETPPAVGSRQHLSLNQLRYCRFQEARLSLIKPKVQSAQDIRTFNLLAVDYNSRCSDFLYRDEDAAIVAGQLDSNRERLAAEADEIVAAWPGHASNQTTK
jgi:hypothetical protein